MFRVSETWVQVLTLPHTDPVLGIGASLILSVLCKVGIMVISPSFVGLLGRLKLENMCEELGTAHSKCQ